MVEITTRMHKTQQRASKITPPADGSGINGQIGAASVLPAMNLTIRAYLGEAHLFTVYSGELVGILLALWTARDHLWLRTKILIFTDNQASIQAISNPGNQSGQSILVNIVTAIDSLRDQGKEVEFHWIPAHQEIEGNELADSAAKRATGWRKKRKRNGRIEERHDGKKAAQTQIPHLRSARSQANLDFVKKAWEDEWTSEKRGRDLRILTPSPSPHTLRIHTQIRKGYSAIITQMRTGKIGLRHFLCLRKVPGFNDPWCTCRNDNQTVRHVLQDCPLYHDLRSTTWAEERGKEPGGVIEWRKMLSHPPFAQKAAQFMLKTGLLGQFEDLKGVSMRL